MCYSATASFSAAMGLSIIGSIGCYYSLKLHLQYLPINLLSFFYAIQQAAEGLIWVAPESPWSNTWAHVFLFFAFFVYPWYIPLSVSFFNPKKRPALLMLTTLGLLFGTFLYYFVARTPILFVKACALHIEYQVPLFGSWNLQNQLTHAVLIPLYIALLALPFFLSQKRYSHTIGYLTLVSAIACLVFYAQYFISLWCFYAALISFAMSSFTYLTWRQSINRLTATKRE